ncbi:hypothetical protein J437_LFUL010848 [Ladona fulva]|uniref:Glutamate [NMDA] receptor subunit 1 n=1 Tax=Ladona fulva TaxID=123851 RepID=A0A8K0KAK3_LADFU|nr:hypothetical protein J437_LFUL010848 [Ladona fulva]
MVRFLPNPVKLDSNPIRAAFDFCERMVSRKVYAVIISHTQAEASSSTAVSYSAGFHNIPIIDMSSRDSSFSDKYTDVLFIHSSNANGRAILGRFEEGISRLSDSLAGSFASDKEKYRIKVSAVVAFNPGLKEFTEQLQDLKNFNEKVFLLYSSANDAEVIFRDAEILRLTGEGSVWLVAEEALNAKNTPLGILGLRLLHATDEDAHFHDIKYMSQQILPLGKTGKVEFDGNGDRMNAEYNLVNKKEAGEVPVGKYYYSPDENNMVLDIQGDNILWPGNTGVKPKGFSTPTHLKILTIGEIPFVYVRGIKLDQSISSKSHTTAYLSETSFSMQKGICDEDELPCPHFNTNNDATNQTNPGHTIHCCKGFCIDFLKKLAEKINFTYNLALSPDGLYGSYVFKDHYFGRKKQWTGLVGELTARRADMVVAPLTINPERSEFIDFSKPFKNQGLTILEKKPSRSSTLMSFLQPFSNSLWMLVMVSVHVVALVLCLFDRFSPFSRFRIIAPQENTTPGHFAGPSGLETNCPSTNVTTHTEEDALNLSSAIWFAWGVLLNSGIGDGTPRSFSARVLGIVWAAFAMMIVASYTANLAAFLVLERPYAKPSGINDAVLLSSFGNNFFATVNGSAVDMYLQRQVELSNLYRSMKGNNYHTADDAIEDVKNEKLEAFIWDNSRLEFEAAMDCELVTTGELFGRSGYGLGLRKDSPWTDAVNLAILDFREDGFFEKMDDKWFPQQDIQCDGINPIEKRPHTLGLKNMAGVFMLVLAGIFGGVALIVIEVFYKRHHAKRQNRKELARYAFDKWRRVIVKRRFIRATVAAHQQQKLQKLLKSNGMNETSATSLPTELQEMPLVSSSVGEVGSLAAAATAVDLKQQMSPRLHDEPNQVFT